MKKMMLHKRCIIETKNPSRFFCAIQKDSIKKKLEGLLELVQRRGLPTFSNSLFQYLPLRYCVSW